MRWLKRTAVGVLLALAVAALNLAWDRHAARAAGEERLAEAEAELDLSDPGWRLDDLLAARDAAVPPDERNLTSLCRDVHAARPKAFEAWLAGRGEWWAGADLNRPLPADRLAAARAELAAAAAAVELARTAPQRPSGGYRLDVKPNPLNTLLPHLEEVRATAALLDAAGAVAAHDGDLPRATADVAAGLHLTAAIGDEPLLISQLVRHAVAAVAVGGAERLVALAEPPPDGLARLGAGLLAEADAARLAPAFRGERAFLHRLMGNLDAGRITLGDVSGDGADRPTAYSAWLLRAHLPANRAYSLEFQTRLVDIARQPPHEQIDGYNAVEPPPKEAGTVLSRLTLPAFQKVTAAEWRTVARLRSAAAGLACERFRQVRGHWPTSLAELGELLPTVPIDPYDGQPLRFARLADGAVVYAVGPDRADDGGHLSYGNPQPGDDVGFRLWDPAVRRRPPPEDVP